MALQGFEGSFMNAAPGAMMTPFFTPLCIIFHVLLIPGILIHKKNPPFGAVNSAKPAMINDFYQINNVPK